MLIQSCYFFVKIIVNIEKSNQTTSNLFIWFTSVNSSFAKLKKNTLFTEQDESEIKSVLLTKTKNCRVARHLSTVEK